MSSRAIVLIPATTTPADLLRPIAGVPALLRLLLSVQRAGLGEIWLVGMSHCPSSIRESLTQDTRIVARLAWLDDQPWSTLVQACPDLEKAWWEGDMWVLPAGGVIDVTLLRDAVQRSSSCAITVIDPEPKSSAMSAVPFFRVSGAWLQSRVEAAADVPLSAILYDMPQSSDSIRQSNHGLVCAPAVSDANRDHVERGLFNSLTSASDGWVDRYLNRRLSPWFTRMFLHMPLTPNQVTLIACAMGLVAAISFAQGGWISGVMGAMLLQWSAVIDCCDGEVARLKFLESASGYYLDIICDNLVHVAVFVAIAWGGYQALGQAHVLLLGVLAAFGTLMDLIVVLVTRHRPERRASATLDRFINALANRDFSLLVVICALTGTLPAFLWTLAIGVNLFWLLALSLAWRSQRIAHE